MIAHVRHYFRADDSQPIPEGVYLDAAMEAEAKAAAERDAERREWAERTQRESDDKLLTLLFKIGRRERWRLSKDVPEKVLTRLITLVDSWRCTDCGADYHRLSVWPATRCDDCELAPETRCLAEVEG